MNKLFFWIGVVVFVVGALCFFLSGSTSGSTSATATPTVPFLYGTNQTLWMGIGIAGIIIAVFGLLLKKKK